MDKSPHRDGGTQNHSAEQREKTIVFIKVEDVAMLRGEH